VSDVLHVKHYQPAEDEGQSGFKPVRKAKRPKTFKGWVFFLLHKLRLRRQETFLKETENLDYPKYDVDALKSQSRNPFHGSDYDVVISEKIHGSSARYVYLDGVMYAGSRNLWLSSESTGYATAALKVNPQIEQWCRQNEGFALYGEVTPTQKGFDYGSKKHQFWLFDIRHPDGFWLDYEDPKYFLAFSAGIQNVPVLYKGGYKDDIVKLLAEDTKSFTHVIDGTVKHIREGIIIKHVKEIPSRKRYQYKIVNNAFLERDSK
jgi:ATP-dependent RNA circularization protein (DNA/RNA ligase family)